MQQHVPAKSPKIIAGDFNDWSQRLSHTLYKELNVIEAFDHAAESVQDESRIKAGLRQALKPCTTSACFFAGPLLPLASIDLFTRFQIRKRHHHARRALNTFVGSYSIDRRPQPQSL